MHHVSGTVYHMIIIFGHLCKIIIFLVDFFHFLKILIFRIFRGEKGEKIAQDDKRFFLSHSLSQEPYIIWLSFMVHMCKMIISPGVFFIFSKFWFSRQKMAQNDLKFCLLHSISQEPYSIWLSFMVHMCKMIISPGVFFIFSKFWFFRQKMAQNDKITLYPRNCTSSDGDFWFTCVKWWYLQQFFFFFFFFFIFSKFWFFRFLGG